MKHYTVKLADGRRLACTDIGAEEGPIVLYLHGNPGSRLEVAYPDYAQAFKRAGLRVLTVDRPGYGGSSRPVHPGHQHFVDDVVQLLDSLSISACNVVGYSRGTLPALALGACLPQRVQSIGLLGATGMPDDPRLLADKSATARVLLSLVKHAPAIARGIMRTNAFLDTVSPSTRVARLKAGLPSVYDHQQLDREGVRVVEAHHEGLSSDPAWVIEDWRSWLVHPLGFNLSDVACPVTVWSGEDDQTCPVSNAQRLANRLPRLVEFATVAQMGHLHTPQVLVQLMQRVCDQQVAVDA